MQVVWTLSSFSVLVIGLNSFKIVVTKPQERNLDVFKASEIMSKQLKRYPELYW